MNFNSHPPCRGLAAGGIPCCLSASCMLESDNYFPGVPVFVISSQYDLFVLSRSLRKFENDTDEVRLLESFRTITEYGGAMKIRFQDAGSRSKNVSYFVPSCLQHVYLATSSLRDVGRLSTYI